MTGPLGNSQFCFPRISMFPETKSRGTLRFLRNKNSTQNSLKQNSLFSSLFSSGPGLMIVLHDFYFPDQDDYSYSSVDFRLKIFWWSFVDYSVFLNCAGPWFDWLDRFSWHISVRAILKIITQSTNRTSPYTHYSCWHNSGSLRYTALRAHRHTGLEQKSSTVICSQPAFGWSPSCGRMHMKLLISVSIVRRHVFLGRLPCMRLPAVSIGVPSLKQRLSSSWGHDLSFLVSAWLWYPCSLVQTV